MRAVSQVPVRRRRSVFSIIGMIVVAAALMVLIYFAWVGWVKKGQPVPDVDVKTNTMNLVAPSHPALEAVPDRA